MKKLLILLILPFVIFGCQNPTELEHNKIEETDLNFETLYISSNQVQIENRSTFVIESQFELDNFLETIPPIGVDHSGLNRYLNLPLVDFQAFRIVGIAFGAQSSSAINGYINQITQINETIYVDSELHIPNEAITADIGYPIHLVLINRNEHKIVFNETEIVHQASGDYPLEYTTYFNDSRRYAYSHPQNFVIRSDEEAHDLVNFLSQHPTGNDPMEVIPDNFNFHTHMLIAVLLGEKSSGGVSLDIDPVMMENGKIAVYSTEDWSNAVTDDIGYPMEVIILNRMDNEVIFKETRVMGKDDSDGPVPSDFDFANTRWRLHSFVNPNGEEIFTHDLFDKLLPGEDFYFQFNENLEMINGMSACNEFSAKVQFFEITGALDIYEVQSTEKNCLVKFDFLNILNYAYKYTIDDEHMLNLEVFHNLGYIKSARFVQI